MKRRLLESVAIGGVLVALIGYLDLSIEGQSRTPGARASGAAGGSAAPRTPWGHPDLQGIWLDEFDTPLERSPKYANKEFLTDAERAEMDEQRSGNPGRNKRAARGTLLDAAGAYNAVFTSVKPTGRRTSMVVEPANGRIPALTAQAQEKMKRDREFRLMLLQNTDTCKTQAAGCAGGQYGPPPAQYHDTFPFYNTQRMNRHDGPEDQSLGDRCMSGVTPDFAGFRRIVQGADQIALGIDTGQGQGYQRIIYLGGSHPPSQVRFRHGDSRGRFDGNTLVVETTNFSPKFPFRGAAENLTLVERFTRLDARTLEYAVTITDPTVWTAPWTVKQELTLQSDDQNRIYYEPRCHEGNYGLPALLIGARLDEKAFAEGRGPNPASQDTATCISGLPEDQQ